MSVSNDMLALLKKAKLRLLRMHYENKIGHIGGNLSSLDAMLFLHLETMKEKDVFVLSKGHAAGALYITLWMKGLIAEEELSTFHQDATRLAGHPKSGWNSGIRFSTGSLGHGLGLATGVALAKRLKKENGHVFCMTSDGEWQEGSNWESLIFLTHHQLNNLTLLVDLNGLQGFGSTQEIASLGLSLLDKFRAFDLDVLEIDGHDLEGIRQALEKKSTRPKLIALHTVKGKGISFMEHQMAWHYLPMSPEQYAQAQKEISE